MTLTLFGPAWTGTLVVLLLVGVGTHHLLRGRDLAGRRRGLAVLAVVDLLSSVSFHLAYLSDPDVHFPLWQNLPLHLCTIVSFLVLPAVLKDARPLQVICFFPGALAGFLTWFSAQPMYFEQRLLDPKLGFFVAHGLNFVIPALMATLGIYRPTARDAVRSVFYVVGLGLAVLPVTLLLRAVADPGANYMYVFGGEGAGILDLFYSFVPVPLLYLFPLLAVITPVLLGQWGAYRAYRWVSGRLDRRTWLRTREVVAGVAEVAAGLAGGR
ncbi:YwaF family protein [Xylanimonas protaetiae]|uniref:TIGR02206 family membrane protein n=1 Tax=Xylanimonas protaetiae TaxID=2509457 RepID=A0A4P6FJ58_9MICO|nr:YwaF family protein [Xylanimonas protaetiae]QAY70608.1 hypothetical protein ET471_11720 [Xylanimonas protaetiae]